MSGWHRWIVPSVIAVSAVSVGYCTEYQNAEQAKKSLFPEATHFVPMNVTLTDAQVNQIESMSGARVRDKALKVSRAFGPSGLLGYFILDNVVGKHEYIDYALALDPKGAVKDFEILVYRETYGSQVKDPKWRHQFTGKTAKDPLKLDHDIQNISGATLSSRHMTDGIKRMLATYVIALK